MLIQNYIITMFLWMLAVNALLFLFILGRKITIKGLDRKKEILRDQYEEWIMVYMTQQESADWSPPSTKLQQKVFEELVVDYSTFLTEDMKELLLTVLGEERKNNEIHRKLNSKNLWKKKIATFQAGEFGLAEASPMLLEQLKLKDRELLFVTARALIKLEGKTYVRDVLKEAGENQRMGKNSVLILLEMVKEDLRDILEEMMLGSNPFLQEIALEIYGKKQYKEGVSWIEKMVAHPSKEMRIAALKGAYSLGDIGEERYFNTIATRQKDQEWEVRGIFAKVLSDVKTEKARGILAELMKDPNWQVRNNAAQALREQGIRGIEILVNLLDSKDRYARHKAWEVIHREIFFNNLLTKLENEPFKNKLVDKMDARLMEVK